MFTTVTIAAAISCLFYRAAQLKYFVQVRV